MKHDQRYIWLDLVRGISAIAVCAGHLRAALLVDYSALHEPTKLQALFYFSTGLGHQAVMVFFVLSGLFVGGSILKSREEFKLATYSIARLTRLWMVLIPALAVTLLVDNIVAIYAPEVLQGAYNSAWNSGPKSAESFSNSALTFLGNILFVQNIFTPVFGTNGPLWSLANEFWYYITFPLLALSVGQCGDSRKLSVRALGGIAGILLLLFLPDGIRTGFLVWLMGVVVYFACKCLSSKRRPFVLICTSTLFLGSLAYSKSTPWQTAFGVPSDYIVGVCFSMFCVVIAIWPPPRGSLFGRAISKIAGAVSEFSYSLYLSHFPFVILIAVFGIGFMKVLPDTKGLVQFFGWLGVLLFLGMLFWFLFERHTNFIKRKVISRIRRHSSRLAPIPVYSDEK